MSLRSCSVVLPAILLLTAFPVTATAQMCHSAYTVVELEPAGYAGSAATAITDMGQVGYGESAIDGARHALLWKDTAECGVDLHPFGFLSSQAWAICCDTQVGSGTLLAGQGKPQPQLHALLWTGDAGSVVDLHPKGYRASEALGGCMKCQVGYGLFADPQTRVEHRRALLWMCSADRVIDLHPAPYVASQANSVCCKTQTGWGTVRGARNLDPKRHALLWKGSARSVVDLNPAGYHSSEAAATCCKTQVGHGCGPDTGDCAHALLWTGSAASAIDLNPAGFVCSRATALCHKQQVGYGTPADSGHVCMPGEENMQACEAGAHALCWSGTPESAMDLHVFLPPQYTASKALSVDHMGRVVGVAKADGNWHAVMWVPTMDHEMEEMGATCEMAAESGEPMECSKCAKKE